MRWIKAVEAAPSDHTLMTPDLVARPADQRLPRYTSYPTTPHFGADVDARVYRTWLAALPKTVRGSLYLHIPYCRAMCWYCACHTTVARRDAPVSGYIRSLRDEIELVATSLGRRLAVNHLHFGGGTPTILQPADLLSLLDLLRARFAVSPGAEIAIEVDPRTLTGDMIAALGAGGTTRASLGVQSFDPAVQRAIGRVQSFEDTARAAEGLRRAGVAALNLDLVYGLPHQTIASCVATLTRCLALRPDRLSVFGYAHVPSFKKHQRKIDAASLPDASARRQQEQAMAQALLAAGYRRIGLDHYALPRDTLAMAQAGGRLRRNFQGYTTDDADVLLGFGASAITRLPQGYVQNEIVLGRYAAMVAGGQLPAARGRALTAEDSFRAELIERVMCDLRVDVGQVADRHNRPRQAPQEAFPALRALQEDGVIRLQGDVIAVQSQARPLLRAVAAAFDGYFGQAASARSSAV